MSSSLAATIGIAGILAGISFGYTLGGGAE